MVNRLSDMECADGRTLAVGHQYIFNIWHLTFKVTICPDFSMLTWSIQHHNSDVFGFTNFTTRLSDLRYSISEYQAWTILLINKQHLFLYPLDRECMGMYYGKISIFNNRYLCKLATNHWDSIAEMICHTFSPAAVTYQVSIQVNDFKLIPTNIVKTDKL